MMIRLLTFVAVLMFSLPLSACIDDLAMSGPGGDTPESKALHQLFSDSDEAALKLSPIEALFRGDAPSFLAHQADQFARVLGSNAQTGVDHGAVTRG